MTRAALFALVSLLWLAPTVELEVATATARPTFEATAAEAAAAEEWDPSPPSSRTAPAIAAASVRRLLVGEKVPEVASVGPLDEAPRPNRTQAPRWRRLPRMTVDGPGDG